MTPSVTVPVVPIVFFEGVVTFFCYITNYISISYILFRRIYHPVFFNCHNWNWNAFVKPRAGSGMLIVFEMIA